MTDGLQISNSAYNTIPAPANLFEIINQSNQKKATIDSNGTANFKGGVAFAIVTKTATYTATKNDYLILCETNSFTINLPALSTVPVGTVFKIKNITTGTTITIDGNASENIDGAATLPLTAQYKFAEIVAGATEWHIVGIN